MLELAWFYAAPFGTALLADLGARVIKVESSFGDPHRYQNPLPEFSGVKALGGKESIVVDYRTPEGREILHRLVARSDVVMRNYRQQNSAAVGDDYESLERSTLTRCTCTPRPTAPTALTPPGPPSPRPWESPPDTAATSWDGIHGTRRTSAVDLRRRGWRSWPPVRARNGGPTNNTDAASAPRRRDRDASRTSGQAKDR